jgi:hypothetical protein
VEQTSTCLASEENAMSEEREKLARTYKRAGFGLGAAAILWLLAIVIDGRLEEGNVRWLIPIGAAAMSIYCFSLYSKSKSQ